MKPLGNFFSTIWRMSIHDNFKRLQHINPLGGKIPVLSVFNRLIHSIYHGFWGTGAFCLFGFDMTVCKHTLDLLTFSLGVGTGIRS